MPFISLTKVIFTSCQSGGLLAWLVHLAKILSISLNSVTARLVWPQLPYSKVSGARLLIKVYHSRRLSIVCALPTAAMYGNFYFRNKTHYMVYSVSSVVS